jgi:hypothetical protein
VVVAAKITCLRRELVVRPTHRRSTSWGRVHTNTIEVFYGLVKSGIRGTYHAVSRKWLQRYLNEYSWRYNERSTSTRSMFESLLAKAAE